VRHRPHQNGEENDASDAAYEENLKIDHANQLNSLGPWRFERISMVRDNRHGLDGPPGINKASSHPADGWPTFCQKDQTEELNIESWPFRAANTGLVGDSVAVALLLRVSEYCISHPSTEFTLGVHYEENQEPNHESEACMRWFLVICSVLQYDWYCFY
jgi:hypothetical protein